MQTLTGKVALVTGGGRGLGEATCQTLAAAGMQVVAADLRRELAEQSAQKIREQGGEALALELDVSDPEQAVAIVDKTIAHYGKLDVLVNNAGTDQTLSIEELSIEDWQRVINVNLNGAFYMAKAAFTHMRENNSGYIVNIVSTAAKRAWSDASAYHASKWGLLGFSHALHVEGRPHQIKVTALLAGGMRTPFLLDRFSHIDPTTLQDPKNVAETICFLLTQPAETVIPELLVLPMKESSWP